VSGAAESATFPGNAFPWVKQTFVQRKEDVMNEWSNAKLCDVANLVLGAILLASPWIFGFASGAVSNNALVSGVIIAVISIAALAAFAVWEEWLNLIVGLWVLASPWVLGFAGSTAMQVHVVIGVIVAVLAALEIWILYQRPPRRTAAG
jgi:heme/copper-type cytochrome/quinol oxidase subunit 3